MQIPAIEEQFPVRAYRSSTDFQPLVRLLTMVEEFDQDGEETSEAAVRVQLSWPEYDPEKNCFVIEAPDSADGLIGYAGVFQQNPDRCACSIAMHPRWRRLGLGQALLKKALHCSKELEATHVTINANAHNEAATIFLQEQGFWQVGDAWLFRAPAQLPLPEVIWPTGYSVQSYAVLQHLPTLVEVSRRSFTDKWGHAENSAHHDLAVGIAKWLPLFDPAGIFLAFAPDGSVIGIARATFNSLQAGSAIEPIDIVDAPGVVPEHRSEAVYRPLLLTAMHWLRAQGEHAMKLQAWGDDEQTIAIYRRIGFELMQHYLSYRRDLR